MKNGFAIAAALALSGCCSHEYRERAATDRIKHAVEYRMKVEARDLKPETPAGVGAAVVEVVYKQEW